jgi:hypothetical protein
MAKYRIKASYTCTCRTTGYMEIEAENIEDAWEKAESMTDFSDLESDGDYSEIEYNPDTVEVLDIEESEVDND